jgi:hypothetical protein
MTMMKKLIKENKATVVLTLLTILGVLAICIQAV